MSTIQMRPPAADKTGKGVKSDQKFASSASHVSADKPRTADQQMTHAWSIGITPTGRAMGKPAPSHEESDTCPPEVYIG